MSDRGDILKGTGNMELDWNLRARTNARFYVECTHHRTDEEFDRSGERDLATFVLRDLQLDPEATVLEIGCGMGRLMKPLASRAREVHGVDVSGEMIARARERLRDHANIHLYKTSGADLASLPDNSFDLCFSFITFQHVPLKQVVYRYFSEVARVLKPAGVFRFQVDGRASDVGRRDNAGTWDGVVFEEVEIREGLSRCGFETVDLWGQDTQFLLITAVRQPKLGVPPTALVRASRRAWNVPSVEALVKRIRPDAADRRTAALLEGSTSLKRLASQFIEGARMLPPEDYVRAAYLLFLNRPPDDEGLRACLDALSADALSREGIVDNLISSQEFRDLLRTEEHAADAVRSNAGACGEGARITPTDKARGPAHERPLETLIAAVSHYLADAGVTEDDHALIRKGAVSIARLAAATRGQDV